MRKSLTVACGGIAVLAVLTSGLGVADAATGGSLLLGHHNHTTKTTVLSDSRGTPLSLKAPSSAPPLGVSNSNMVPRLNSQYLDGFTAGQIATHSAQVLAELSGGVGTAYCPAGTTAVGGGVLPDVSAPDDDGAFLVASIADVDDNSHFDGWFGAAADSDATYGGGGYVFVTCSTGSFVATAQMAAVARTERAAAQASVARYRAQRR